jgi:hypothetical protein
LPNHPGDSIEDLCSSATASRVKPWTTIGFGAYDFAIPFFFGNPTKTKMEIGMVINGLGWKYGA